MGKRAILSGSYRIAQQAAFENRMAKLAGDARQQFYKAMLRHDNYSAYEAAVGSVAVNIPGYIDNPITGHDEILYARRRGWIRDGG